MIPVSDNSDAICAQPRLVKFYQEALNENFTEQCKAKLKDSHSVTKKLSMVMTTVCPLNM